LGGPGEYQYVRTQWSHCRHFVYGRCTDTHTHTHTHTRETHTFQTLCIWTVYRHVWICVQTHIHSVQTHIVRKLYPLLYTRILQIFLRTNVQRWLSSSLYASTHSLKNVSSCCRMCSLTAECVLLLQNLFSDCLHLRSMHPTHSQRT